MLKNQSGASLGPLGLTFGALKIELFSSMGPRRAPRDLSNRFWVFFERILIDSGRFGGGFGTDFRDFVRFSISCEHTLDVLETI